MAGHTQYFAVLHSHPCSHARFFSTLAQYPAQQHDPVRRVLNLLAVSLLAIVQERGDRCSRRGFESCDLNCDQGNRWGEVEDILL